LSLSENFVPLSCITLGRTQLRIPVLRQAPGVVRNCRQRLKFDGVLQLIFFEIIIGGSLPKDLFMPQAFFFFPSNDDRNLTAKNLATDVDESSLSVAKATRFFEVSGEK